MGYKVLSIANVILWYSYDAAARKLNKRSHAVQDEMRQRVRGPDRTHPKDGSRIGLKQSMLFIDITSTYVITRNTI